MIGQLRNRVMKATWASLVAGLVCCLLVADAQGRQAANHREPKPLKIGAVNNQVIQSNQSVLFYFILFYFILFYFILFYFILFYFILFYFILFYFIFNILKSVYKYLNLFRKYDFK